MRIHIYTSKVVFEMILGVYISMFPPHLSATGMLLLHRRCMLSTSVGVHFRGTKYFSGYRYEIF